jgi:hypothetical protein
MIQNRDESNVQQMRPPRNSIRQAKIALDERWKRIRLEIHIAFQDVAYVACKLLSHMHLDGDNTHWPV